MSGGSHFHIFSINWRTIFVWVILWITNASFKFRSIQFLVGHTRPIFPSDIYTLETISTAWSLSHKWNFFCLRKSALHACTSQTWYRITAIWKVKWKYMLLIRSKYYRILPIGTVFNSTILQSVHIFKLCDDLKAFKRIAFRFFHSEILYTKVHSQCESICLQRSSCVSVPAEETAQIWNSNI